MDEKWLPCPPCHTAREGLTTRAPCCERQKSHQTGLVNKWKL